MKKVFLFIVTFNIYLFAFASNSDSSNNTFRINLGLNAGITQQYLLNTDNYLGFVFKDKKGPFYAINLGININSNRTSYNRIENIQYKSYGVYFEFNYGFKSNIFMGFRIQPGVSVIEDKSLYDYDQKKGDRLNGWFPAITLLTQIGYRKDISKNLGVLVLAQAGVHHYDIYGYISPSVSFSNSNDFLGTLSLGLYYNIFKKKW